MKKIFLFLICISLVSSLFAAYGGDSLGSHKATRDLDMNTKNITNPNLVDDVDVGQFKYDVDFSTDVLDLRISNVAATYQHFYFTNRRPISSQYWMMLTTVPNSTQSEISFTATTDLITIASFTTCACINVRRFPEGLWVGRFHAYVSGVGIKDVQLRYDIYDGTGTTARFLFNLDNSPTLTTADAHYNIYMSTIGIDMQSGYLGVRVIADLIGTGNDPIVHFLMEGSKNSKLEVPVLVSEVAVTKLTAGTNLTSNAERGDVTIDVERVGISSSVPVVSIAALDSSEHSKSYASYICNGAMDGTGDETEIQQALDVFGSYTQIQLLDGTFYFKDKLFIQQSHVSITGIPSATIIKATDNWIGGNSATYVGYGLIVASVSALTDISIANIIFDGNTANNATRYFGVEFCPALGNHILGVDLLECKFINFDDTSTGGLFLYVTKSVMVNDCRFETCFQGNYLLASSSIAIANCIYEDISQYGLVIGNCEVVSFVNNIVTGVTTDGIYMDSVDKLSAEANVINVAGAHGFRLDNGCKNCQISNNGVFNCVTYGITVEVGNTDTVIGLQAFSGNGQDINDEGVNTNIHPLNFSLCNLTRWDGFPAGYVFSVEQGTVVAQELVDTSEIYTGDALSELSQITYEGTIEDGWGDLDHATLPDDLKHIRVKNKYIHKITGKEYDFIPELEVSSNTWEMDDPSNYNVTQSTKQGSRVFRKINYNMRAIIQMKELIEALTNRVIALENP